MVPIKAALDKFACAGLVTCEEKGIRLTDDGLPYSRHVAALFDASQRVV
jgi:coproporphyrinogen III oxidase-like Fe-S oxidoreductase